MIDFTPFCPPALPPGAQPQLARRQIQVVMDHQDISRRDLVERGQRADSLAAHVHVRHRLDEQHAARQPSLSVTVAQRSARPFGTCQT